MKYIIVTILFYVAAIYFAYFAATPHPIALFITLTTAHSMFFYGVWVKEWFLFKK